MIPRNAVTRISLVRHASVHNPSNIFYGRLPGFYLSKRERLEAARSLKDLIIEDIISSPLLRCRQTAAEILNRKDEHPSIACFKPRIHLSE